jgi:hypothetical protein
MALEKVITQDRIEVVGPYKAVQIRTCTQVLEDGVELSSGYHRHVVVAGQDYSNESVEVQAICAAVHTDTIAQLERNSADNGVTVAHWRCSKTEGDHTASSYGTCGFTPDVEKAGFVAFDALTEEAVIGWVQESMDVEALEAGLDAQLAEMAAPSTVAGTPW